MASNSAEKWSLAPIPTCQPPRRLSEESRCVLPHQAVQRGLLGLVARAVDQGAIAMRRPGLVSVGLHALGMEDPGWCSFSGRAGLRIRLWGDQLPPAPGRRACSGAAPCPGAPPPAMRWQPLRDGVPSAICLGKLSGSKTASPTVGNADGPGANPLPARQRQNASTPTVRSARIAGLSTCGCGATPVAAGAPR